MKETAKNLFFSSESNLTSCDTLVLQLFSVQFCNSPLQDNHVKLHYLQVDLADASKHEYTRNHFFNTDFFLFRTLWYKFWNMAVEEKRKKVNWMYIENVIL